ncbi:hypothetical protein DMUE_0738 [Dictyocoela muelleri]|nr:hypothetical protein DMUE_0738 [Dictyocoela muelleri]
MNNTDIKRITLQSYIGALIENINITSRTEDAIKKMLFLNDKQFNSLVDDIIEEIKNRSLRIKSYSKLKKLSDEKFMFLVIDAFLVFNHKFPKIKNYDTLNCLNSELEGIKEKGLNENKLLGNINKEVNSSNEDKSALKDAISSKNKYQTIKENKIKKVNHNDTDNDNYKVNNANSNYKVNHDNNDKFNNANSNYKVNHDSNYKVNSNDNNFIHKDVNNSNPQHTNEKIEELITDLEILIGKLKSEESILDEILKENDMRKRLKRYSEYLKSIFLKHGEDISVIEKMENNLNIGFIFDFESLISFADSVFDFKPEYDEHISKFGNNKGIKRFTQNDHFSCKEEDFKNLIGDELDDKVFEYSFHRKNLNNINKNIRKKEFMNIISMVYDEIYKFDLSSEVNLLVNTLEKLKKIDELELKGRSELNKVESESNKIARSELKNIDESELKKTGLKNEDLIDYVKDDLKEVINMMKGKLNKRDLNVLEEYGRIINMELHFEDLVGVVFRLAEFVKDLIIQNM